MKNLTKIQKIIILIIAIIIVAGIAVTFITGFNFDLRYKNTKRVSLYLQKTYEVSDIKKIAKEAIPDQKVLVEKVEIYGDSVSVIAKDITEEQKQSLIEKINEKYETEFKAEEVEIETVAHARGRDLLKRYIMPFAISTVIIMVYMGLRYNKLDWTKVVLKTVASIILTQAVLFSVIAITRIPVGRITIPLVIIVYIATLLGLTNKLEKQLGEMAE